MGKLIEFIAINYVWFLTVTLILIFALIGYIVDSKREKNDILMSDDVVFDEESLENLVIPEGKKLNESIQKSASINAETNKIELNDESILNDNIK